MAPPDLGKHLGFSFLTTDAKEDVKPIHPDAKPVFSLDELQRDQWMNAPWEIGLELQKPPPKGVIKIVATGKKVDA